MFVKRYIAEDMSQAMEKILHELGPEAVILNSKPIRRKGIFGFFQKKLVEVIVAYEPGNKDTPITLEPDENLQKNTQSTEKKVINSNTKVLYNSAIDSVEMQALTEKLDHLSHTVEEFSASVKRADEGSTLRFKQRVAEIYEKLIDADVGKDLAWEICKQTQDTMERQDIDADQACSKILMEKIGLTIPIEIKPYRRNVLMLIGPTGMGKTTTLVKLAGLFMIAKDLKVGIINTDTYRISAHEQLKTYAEILGIPLYTVYSPEELTAAMQSLEDCDVVLIDTAGKAPGSQEYREDLTALMQADEIDEVLLTISLVSGDRAVKEIISNYSYIPNYKIIVTKLDEISKWGNILNIAGYAKRPFAYVTTGQSVPDDIEEVDAQIIVDNILARKG